MCTGSEGREPTPQNIAQSKVGKFPPVYSQTSVNLSMLKSGKSLGSLIRAPSRCVCSKYILTIELSLPSKLTVRRNHLAGCHIPFDTLKHTETCFKFP